MTETLFVSGGGGFLGLALIKALKARGYRLKTINRGSYPELEGLGIEVLRGDLADYETVKNALQGCSAVFHVAAKPGVWGPYEDYYQSNVQSTLNIIRACRELGIRKLIFTSSPSVTFAGVDQINADESQAYPDRYLCPYPETKALAERHALAANGPDLATVSLRPHLIWGPGDRHLIPRLVDRARKGRLRLIGDRACKVDAVYIDNAVDAHILAFERLDVGARIAGKAYYIGNGEPVLLEDMINRLLAAAGEPSVSKRISVGTALFVARILETLHKIFARKGEPLLTRFVVLSLSTSHWFNPKNAEDDLGYKAKISMDEGFERLRRHLQSKDSL